MNKTKGMPLNSPMEGNKFTFELKKAIDFGKEKEATPWLSYIESTEGLRAAVSS